MPSSEFNRARAWRRFLFRTGVVALWALIVVLIPTLAQAQPARAACSWDAPGHNPYTGSVPGAVVRYQHIPTLTRLKLQQRMELRAYDDIAVITRDAIIGDRGNYEDLRLMHFGQGTVCQSVSRAGWPASAVERGLVYCEDGHCVIVPTVCRNVSIVSGPIARRALVPAASALEVAGGPALVPPASLLEDPELEERGSFRGLALPPLAMSWRTPAESVADDLVTPTTAPFSSVPLVDLPRGSGLPASWVVTGPPAIGSSVRPVLPIPEPTTWALMILGLVLVLRRVRRAPPQAAALMPPPGPARITYPSWSLLRDTRRPWTPSHHHTTYRR